MESGPHIRLILARAANAIEKVDRASIDNTGLNLSDFSILEALLHKGPLPVNTIGKKVLLTSGSMTTAANRLMDKDLIKRSQDPSDGRLFHLDLTLSGRQLIKQAYKKHSRNLEKVAEVLTIKERTQIVKLLKKIGRHAQSLDIE
jgi:MarR family transcriptional regulator, 2-MHQ and catechol-resistance regulon repressor